MNMPRKTEEFLALTPLQRAAIIASVTYSIGYFIWRAATTVNAEYLAYSWTYFAFDLFGFLNSLLFMTTTWRIRSRRSVKHTGKQTVDVYIPTINESTELLRTTLYHVLKMDYPHETYILDDGRRPEVRELAESMGVKYITRPDNKDAKAGNLNHALAQTHGDLIAVFDADGVPRRDFLTQLLGYFDNPKVALVQTPNAFYNLDSFQHWSENSGKNTWNEQALWFDVIQRGHDFHGASVWCGNGSMLRRKALAEVGGVATESVTEDMLTTLNLHAAGYETVFHDEPIAFCLAPTSIEPYLVQRGRWAMGALQILKKEIYKLLLPGKLKFHHRVAYLSTIYYFSSIQKLLYYVAPFLYLMYDIAPVNQPDQLVLPLFLYVGSSTIAFKILARGSGRVFRGESYFLHLVPVYIKAIILGLIPFFKGRFKVTPKEPGVGVPMNLWITPVLVFLVSGAAIAAGVFRFYSGNEFKFAYFLTMLVALYYMAIAVYSFMNMSRSPLSKNTYSFFDYRPVQIKSQNDAVSISNNLGIAFVISDENVQIAHMGPLPHGAHVKFDLDLPSATLPLEGIVSRCEPWIIRGMDPLFIIDMKLYELKPEVKEVLSRYYFEDATPRAMNTTAKVLRETSTDLMRRKSVRLPTLLPIIIEEAKTSGRSQLGLLVDVSNEGARLKFPSEISVGEQVSIQLPWIKKVISARIARCNREHGQLNPPYDIGITFNQDVKMENETLTEFSELKEAIG